MLIRQIFHNLHVEHECANEKEAFEALSHNAEVFDHRECGACHGKDLRFAVRKADKFTFYELHCQNKDCRARLAFGQHKNATTLFPKRKDDDDNWLPNNGWVKYDPAKVEEKTETKSPKKTKK